MTSTSKVPAIWQGNSWNSLWIRGRSGKHHCLYSFPNIDKHAWVGHTHQSKTWSRWLANPCPHRDASVRRCSEDTAVQKTGSQSPMRTILWPLLHHWR